VQRLAAALARARVHPNWISAAGVLAAVLSGLCLLVLPSAGVAVGSVLLILGAVLLMVRGLCAVLDGLVAVEGGLGGPAGQIANDFPERLSDSVMLVCAGYATGGWPPGAAALGWLAALLAVLTAYSRILAASLGVQGLFLGPMGKQHRIWVMVGAMILAAPLRPWRGDAIVITVALGAVCVGAVVTIVRRLRRAARELGEAR
jgi:phosphatidylglycerophosphate synthase